MDAAATNQTFYELNKKITSVYFTTNRFKLKNDCVCRLIAETFPELTSVSILLYESKRDSLINFGHFLDVDKIEAKFSERSTVSEFLLKNISLYEFFTSKREALSLKFATLNDYKSSPYFYSENLYTETGDKTKISAAQFERLKKEFIEEIDKKNPDSKQNQYKNYKIRISAEDRYELESPSSISGLYFKDLILGGLSEDEKKFNVASAQELATTEKVLNQVYEREFSVELAERYSYISIPLHVNGRYIGLIRFLLLPEKDQIGRNPATEMTEKKEFKGLKELSETIALHIGNDFYTYGFKQAARSSLQDYDDYAELYADAINSRLCIIRASDENGKNIGIKGFTKVISPYVEDILNSEEDHILKNKDVLEDLFKPLILAKKELNIIAILFEVTSNTIDKIRYLYFYKNEFINTEHAYFGRQGDQAALEKIFNQRVIESLNKINIHEVMLIRIPHMANNFISFANTVYRKFVVNDLDIIYPQIQRLGSDLSMQQMKSRQQKSEMLAGLYHALELPVQLAKSKITKTKRYIDDLIEQDMMIILREVSHIKSNSKNGLKELVEFEYLIKFIDFHFVLLKIKQGIDENTVYGDFAKSYSFRQTIETYIDIHTEYALDRHKIAIFKDWDENFLDVPINHHEMLFLGIFLCLIENALKYSFPEKTRAIRVKGYDQVFSKKSDGHIKVNLFRNEDEYGYSITNWGKKIPADYITNQRIFKSEERCPKDDDFDDPEAPVTGDGKGLYYVKKLIDSSNGAIVIESEGNRIKVTVSWKLPKQ